jgi:hypothetical protein
VFIRPGLVLFPSKENDRAFGEWCKSISSNLEEGIHPAEQSPPTWGAYTTTSAPLQFGQWLRDHQLGGHHDDERAAAMWAMVALRQVGGGGARS